MPHQLQLFLSLIQRRQHCCGRLVLSVRATAEKLKSSSADSGLCVQHSYRSADVRHKGSSKQRSAVTIGSFASSSFGFPLGTIFHFLSPATCMYGDFPHIGALRSTEPSSKAGSASYVHTILFVRMLRKCQCGRQGVADNIIELCCWLSTRGVQKCNISCCKEKPPTLEKQKQSTTVVDVGGGVTIKLAKEKFTRGEPNPLLSFTLHPETNRKEN